MAIGKSHQESLPSRRSLFWDVNPKEVDLNKHAQYIIERILEFGRDEEVRWMKRNYSQQAIKEVTEKSRVLHPKTKSLWRLITKAG